jgi:hypothetical protein
VSRRVLSARRLRDGVLETVEVCATNLPERPSTLDPRRAARVCARDDGSVSCAGAAAQHLAKLLLLGLLREAEKVRHVRAQALQLGDQRLAARREAEERLQAREAWHGDLQARLIYRVDDARACLYCHAAPHTLGSTDALARQGTARQV